MYPYQISLDEEFLKPDFLFQKYSKKKETVKSNIVRYGNNSLLLLIEGNTNGFAEGRFLKLRIDAPRILNELSKEENAEETDIDLENGQWIEEISHFILNIKDYRLLGEYNQSGVRHFATPLNFYLRKTLDLSEDQVSIKPILIENVLRRIKQSGSLFAVTVTTSKPRLPYMEGILKLNPTQVLKAYNKSDFNLEISVKHVHRKALDKEEAIKNIEELFESKDELESLKVETNDAAYDLIKGALMHFKDDIVLDQKAKFVSSLDFYQKARRIYNDNREAILGGEQKQS